MLNYKEKLKELAFAFIGQQCILPPLEGRAKEMNDLRKNMEIGDDKTIFFWGNHYKSSGLSELRELRKHKPREIINFYSGDKAYTNEGKDAIELYPIYFVVETDLVNKRTQSN